MSTDREYSLGWMIAIGSGILLILSNVVFYYVIIPMGVRDSISLVLLVGTMVLAGLGIMIGGYMHSRASQKALEAIEDEESEPALTTSPDLELLRQAPPQQQEERIRELEEHIQFIGVIRTPQSQGGYGGGGINPGFESFAVDIHGVSHTIAEGDDWSEVERDAKWLAEVLEVPYRDRSYG